MRTKGKVPVAAQHWVSHRALAALAAEENLLTEVDMEGVRARAMAKAVAMILRHREGDWGEAEGEDLGNNFECLCRCKGPLLSVFLRDDVEYLVVTEGGTEVDEGGEAHFYEADWDVTSVLLASEFEEYWPVERDAVPLTCPIHA
jgi:hypothetical protein